MSEEQTSATETDVAAETPTAATAVADAPVTQPAPAAPSVEPKYGFWWGTGRRKTAVARVRVRTGKGEFLINGRKFDVFFTEMRDRNDVVAPLKATKTDGGLDVFVNVHGGGFTGQAGAVQLGLARALMQYDGSLEPILRDNDMLTRDARKVERKKPGQPGARKRFQFSKR